MQLSNCLVGSRSPLNAVEQLPRRVALALRTSRAGRARSDEGAQPQAQQQGAATIRRGVQV
jgi:hypothetical protein